MTVRKRKPITLKTQVAVLREQALCPKCGQRLGSDIEWNHVLEFALGGSDGPENIEAVHRDCHKIISFGSGATTAGASAGKVAKTKRIREKNEGRAVSVRVSTGSCTPFEPPKARAGGSPFKAKIQSRGFQKPPSGYKHFLSRAGGGSRV